VSVLDIKEAVRRRDGYRCAQCGMTNEEHLATFGRTLEVHRVTPGSPYTVSGCRSLCKRCHGPQPRQPPGAVDQAVAGIRVGAVLREEIASGFRAYSDHLDPRCGISAIVTYAVERLLEEEGFLPYPLPKRKPASFSDGGGI
jgi:hypothetical protein